MTASRSPSPRRSSSLSRGIQLFLPRRDLTPREEFQAKFLVGANLLAILVALPSIFSELSVGHGLAASIILSFLVTSVGMLLALRLGARLPLLVWAELGALAIFLTVVSMVTVEVQQSQLHWLLLLPLSSMVLVDPRHMRASHLPSRSVPLVVSGGTLLLGLGIVEAHHLGWTFGVEAGPHSDLMAVVEHLTFFVATAGLLLLYDRTARDNVAELATLRKLLSMCAWCRRIRDEHQGGWVEVEQYVTTHVSRLTHGICPDCARRHFGPDSEPHP